MKGRALIQYLINISNVVPAKKKEAGDYLAKLEARKEIIQPKMHLTALGGVLIGLIFGSGITALYFVFFIIGGG